MGKRFFNATKSSPGNHQTWGPCWAWFRPLFVKMVLRWFWIVYYRAQRLLVSVLMGGGGRIAISSKILMFFSHVTIHLWLNHYSEALGNLFILESSGYKHILQGWWISDCCILQGRRMCWVINQNVALQQALLAQTEANARTGKKHSKGHGTLLSGKENQSFIFKPSINQPLHDLRFFFFPPA